jgi:hypothetical protein
MRRVNLLLALTLAPAGAHAAPDAGSPPPADDRSLDALCKGAPTAEIALDPNEFELRAYDASRHLLAVHTEEELAPSSRRPVLVRIARLQDVLLRLAPDAFTVVQDEHHAGRLRLAMVVRRDGGSNQADAPAGGGPCAGGVVDVEPTRVRLERDDFVLAEADLTPQPKPLRIAFPEVRVGAIKAANGSPPVEAERLRAPIHDAGVRCLRAVARDLHSLNGAMTVELERSPVGEPLPPRIRIDAVVFSPLSACLPGQLVDTAAIWDVLPPGGKVYFPLYFRGSPVTLPADTGTPLTRGAKAP